MAYNVTVNKEDLRTEAQKELEATAEMLKGQSGLYDVFGRFEDNRIIDTAHVPLRSVPVEKLDSGALVNGTELPNGWAAQTAVYLGSIKPGTPPQS
jgi:hypothetical protein